MIERLEPFTYCRDQHRRQPRSPRRQDRAGRPTSARRVSPAAERHTRQRRSDQQAHETRKPATMAGLWLDKAISLQRGARQ